MAPTDRTSTASAPWSATRPVQCLILAACAALCALPASAAMSYAIRFERSGFGSQYSVTQSTPLQHQDSYAVPGTINAIFAGHAFAYPGHIGLTDRVEMLWTGPIGTTRYDVYCTATTDDFIITGPAAPQVAGQLHLRVRGQFSRAGGFAGNGSHGSRLNVDVRAKYGQLAAIGDFIDNNYTTGGTGVLAGLTEPDLDFAFVLQGNFPVGTPFNVVLTMSTIEFTYGDGGSDPNPGYALTDASSTPNHGLFLEEVGGQVMALPEGYTLNSANWGIVDNHFHSLVGVEPTIAPGPLQLSVSPNPASGAVRLSLTLPQAGAARVAVFDLAGRRVRLLSEGARQAGRSELVWDGRTDDGRAAGAGLYFARAEVGGGVASRRIIRVR